MGPIRKSGRERNEQSKPRIIIKNILLIVLGLGLGILIGSQFVKKSPQPWKPVLETANFDYMDDILNNAVLNVKDAVSQGQNAQMVESTSDFQQIELALFKLKYYYLPITEVRQLIFDSDRLFYLGEKEEAYQKLTNARALLESIAESDVLSVQKPLTELISLLEELMVSMSKNSPGIAEQFHEVGHRVNMMAYKGELIISDVKIPEAN